jgi:HEAT repeat protein
MLCAATPALTEPWRVMPEGGPAREFLSPDFDTNPYDWQVEHCTALLSSATAASERAGAAEALGYLRAYAAAPTLIQALSDDSDLVRREAAMALAWTGDARAVYALLDALEDSDWVTRQAAWVSLTNLTGLQWPFNANGSEKDIEAQASVWRETTDTPFGQAPSGVMKLVRDNSDDEERLRGVRALGTFGGDGATQAIVGVLLPFKDRDLGDVSDLERHLVQACLQSLGRLGRFRNGIGNDVLIDFLETEGWARYAADALGDTGSAEAIEPLIAAYPRFSRVVNNRMGDPEACPSDDCMTAENTLDRVLETPHNILLALSRLPLGPEHVDALRGITPHILVNFPSDWDTSVVYDIESHQRVNAYVLEKAGMREMALDAAFRSAEHPEAWQEDWEEDYPFDPAELSVEAIIAELATQRMGDVPYMATWFSSFCTKDDVPRLIALLENDSGWIKINAVKALMFLGDERAIDPIGKLLADSHPEAAYGFSGVLEHAEYDDPAPRVREAYIRALSRLGATQYLPTIADILTDEHNVMEMQYAAALALDELGTPAALDALRSAEAAHPKDSVRQVAREAMYRRGLHSAEKIEEHTQYASTAPVGDLMPTPASERAAPEAYVFIKGNKQVTSDFNGQAGVDPWRQTYTVTNSGPTMRRGNNLYVFRPGPNGGEATALTQFEDGFIADCEVSWDGTRIIFARRLNGDDRNYFDTPVEPSTLKSPDESPIGGADDPWWQIWEINADGTGLRQLTFGPYHHVHPAYLPDGRIVFTSSRLGLRDEYHGYPATGLTVMNGDGSDLHPIGFNLGADRDPAVMHDGRIVFSRLDNFYSRLKTESTIQAVYPDGTKNVAMYGPERRDFWVGVHKENAAWTKRDAHQNKGNSRNRVLRVTQPQSFADGRLVCASSGGLVIVGPGRYKEHLIPHDRKFAVTSPFPMDNTTILCAATVKQFDIDGKIITVGSKEFEALERGPELFRAAINIDLALYTMDAETGEMTLLYNDPDAADFEARPLMARATPPTLIENPATRSRSFTAKLFCNSARFSQEERVQTRGALIRVIEGRPFVARHETQQSLPRNRWGDNRWKNHGGTFARVLGTAPLAEDGSFFLEIPADRLVHLQVLDSDRRVVGNQTFWMYARPGETRSCVGCHEKPGGTDIPNHFPQAAATTPIKMLPKGDEFSYRAKSWLKGWTPDEVEERTRTVHSVNLMGRY